AVQPVVISTPTVPPTAAAAAPTPATVPTATAAAAAAAASMTNAFGKTIPADGAPTDKQFLVSAGPGGKVMDFMESVYDRAPGADYFGLSLTLIDNNFNIGPGVADKFEISADGLSWTFTLKKGIKWSDGADLTAQDYVESFKW